MAACPRISSGAVGSSINLDKRGVWTKIVSQSVCIPSNEERRAIRAYVPRFDLCERGHIVDRLLHVPHLVRVNHKYCTGRTRVLPCERRIICRGDAARTGTGRLGVVRRRVPLTLPLWVVDDRTYQPAAPQVIREVCAHFHFEVVEAGLDGFFCQPCDLLIRVPWRRENEREKRDIKWCQRSNVPRAVASFHQGRHT